MIRTLLLTVSSLTVVACTLPFAAGAPESAATVGKGNLGGTLTLELPAPDLVLDNAEPPPSGEEAKAPATAWPDLGVQAAFGLGEHLDLEIRIDGPFYLVGWLPTFVAGGLRLQLIDSAQTGGKLDLAVAARFGGGGIDANVDTFGEHDLVKAAAMYGGGSVVAEFGGDASMHVRLAGQALFGTVWGDEDGSAADDGEYDTAWYSMTLAVAFRSGKVEIAPYVAVSRMTDTPFGDQDLVSGGLYFTIRPNRHDDKRSRQLSQPVAAPSPPAYPRFPPPAPQPPPGGAFPSPLPPPPPR
jgi:hypothetical protein